MKKSEFLLKRCVFLNICTVISVKANKCLVSHIEAFATNSPRIICRPLAILLIERDVTNYFVMDCIHVERQQFSIEILLEKSRSHKWFLHGKNTLLQNSQGTLLHHDLSKLVTSQAWCHPDNFNRNISSNALKLFLITCQLCWESLEWKQWLSLVLHRISHR